MQYAILDANNVVTNIIIGNGSDPGFTSDFPNAVLLTEPGGIGSTYDPVGGAFSSVPEPTPPTT